MSIEYYAVRSKINFLQHCPRCVSLNVFSLSEDDALGLIRLFFLSIPSRAHHAVYRLFIQIILDRHLWLLLRQRLGLKLLLWLGRLRFWLLFQLLLFDLRLVFTFCVVLDDYFTLLESDDKLAGSIYLALKFLGIKHWFRLFFVLFKL